MKINPETKYQDLALYVKDHLDFIAVDQVKSGIIVMILVLYDLPLLLSFSEVLKLEFLWIVLPFILIIHLWGIRLIIKNPYSTQLETILYMGVWGVLGAISLFIMILGMLYYTFQITSVFLYIIMVLTIFICIYILIKYQINKFSHNPTKERKGTDQYKYMGLLSASPGLGYLFFVLVKDNSILDDMVTIVIVYFFAIICTTVAAKFLHRYIFMKTNIKYVKYQPINAKERKKIINQGVEIKQWKNYYQTDQLFS